MNVADLARTRFAYSPLAEVAESLYLLSSRRYGPFHRAWAQETVGRLDAVDMELLGAVVPARPCLADFFAVGVTDATTSFDRQLQALADLPTDLVRRELETVWRGDPLPAAARRLIEDGAAGPRRLADELARYWRVAIEPHWNRMRAVLDDDVAHRAATLTTGGVGALFAGLHPELALHGETLRIQKVHAEHQDLAGNGLVLVPSIFVWPNVVFAAYPADAPSLTYAARGVGNLWTADEEPPPAQDGLGALLGHSRAAILRYLVVPHSTTELAVRLAQSPPSVSQHLAVLRRTGLVTSWRSGRSMLSRRTDLAASIVGAGAHSADERRSRPA